MSKYICILGKSASGKTTLVGNLLKHPALNVKAKVLYTTRPMRPGEVNGVDYWFTTEEDWLALRASGRIIEEREFYVGKGMVRYATCLDEDEGLNDDSDTMFVVPCTYDMWKSFKKVIPERNLIGIYLDIDDVTLIERSLAREKLCKEPDIKEICRRFMSDDKQYPKDLSKEMHIIPKCSEKETVTRAIDIILLKIGEGSAYDLVTALIDIARTPICRSKGKDEVKEFLEVVSAEGYSEIVKEIEFAYKEDLNDKTMKLGSYGSIRYVFLAPPISEKPTLFIRDFDKKLGKTITANGIIQEYRF